MSTPEKYVYIVEDEESLGVSLKIFLDASGFSTKVFASAHSFQKFCKEVPALKTDRIDNQKAEATLTREATAIPVFTGSEDENTPVASIESIISPDAPTKIEANADTEEMRKDSKVSAAMPEMDFPARVINLKIENDQLNDRLDRLEQRNMP